jgi:hypothetical protein
VASALADFRAVDRSPSPTREKIARRQSAISEAA